MSVLDHMSLLIWQSMTSDKDTFPGQIKIKEINPLLKFLHIKDCVMMAELLAGPM